MKERKVTTSASLVQVYNELFDIRLSAQEAELMTTRLNVLLSHLAPLWEHDLTEHEMCLVFPVRRR